MIQNLKNMVLFRKATEWVAYNVFDIERMNNNQKMNLDVVSLISMLFCVSPRETVDNVNACIVAMQREEIEHEMENTLAPSDMDFNE